MRLKKEKAIKIISWFSKTPWKPGLVEGTWWGIVCALGIFGWLSTLERLPLEEKKKLASFSTYDQVLGYLMDCVVEYERGRKWT